jgi:hypothetical protein
MFYLGKAARDLHYIEHKNKASHPAFFFPFLLFFLADNLLPFVFLLITFHLLQLPYNDAERRRTSKHSALSLPI